MTPDTRPPLDLNPDAPHDPDRTRALADTAAECIRALNYATNGGGRGLMYPADAYDLLGTLGILAGRLPQLCEQTGMWLTDQQAAGNLAEVPAPRGRYGGDSQRAVTAAGSALAEAATVANRLGRLLREAQAAISGVEYAGPDCDTDGDCPDCGGRGVTADDEPCLNCGMTGREGDNDTGAPLVHAAPPLAPATAQSSRPRCGAPTGEPTAALDRLVTCPRCREMRLADDDTERTEQ